MGHTPQVQITLFKDQCESRLREFCCEAFLDSLRWNPRYAYSLLELPKEQPVWQFGAKDGVTHFALKFTSLPWVP